ncbi:uncharacterized protein [Ptychodera flava]|uniref:uncharacterized protein n=1 Tax=Ptychodera flava TaxID=63121 RepID=UPI00396A80BE
MADAVELADVVLICVSEKYKNSNSCRSVSVKLPKLDLVSFGGDVLAWKEFWDSFECTIHQNSHLSRIEKFNYLRSKLHGDALNALSEVLFQLELQNGSREKWTVCKLRELLERYVMAAEATDRQTSHNFPSTKDKATPKKSPSASKLYAESSVSSAQALVIGERGPTHQASEKLNPKKRCHFCEQHHWSDEWTKYSTVEARKEKVKGQCYICLKKGHRLKDCVVNEPCFFCRQRKNHHSSLCPKRFPSTRKENTLLTQGLPKDAEPNTEKALMASGEIVLMQTATTMIENPDSSLKQSVRILFDSGSHRSYITDDLARTLRLKTGTVEEMSIVTF